MLLAALAAVALTQTGCGDDGDPSTGNDAAIAAKGQGGRDGDAAGAGKAPKSVLSSGDRVVLIGDSLATHSPPTYADLLPAAAAKRGAGGVETVNLAEPGTTTADWLPGTPLFEERLRPALADADVVLVSVGGNDLQEALGGTNGVEAASGGALEAADAAFAAVDRSGRNLRRTFKAIHAAAPGAKIVYVAYPDYSSASEWQAAIGSGAAIALGVGLSQLLAAAEDAKPDAVVDMLAETTSHRGGVDPLLTELEYLSPAGHRFYAGRIAEALTGSG